MGHDSWFSVLFTSMFLWVQDRIAEMNAVVRHTFNLEGPEGSTWIAHAENDPQHVVGGVFVVLLMIGVGFVASRQLANTKAALVPDDKLSARTFVELFVGAVYGMMSDMMGKKAARFFLPLIGTCAFFIFFSNAIGLVPGFLPPTGNLNTTLACSILIFLATHIYGTKEHGLAYFKHFLGPIWWLAPLILPIELISHFVRPASLAIRLMANMTADHMVLTIFIGLVPFIVPVPMYILGGIVVVVQTLVFCLLSTVYISMAIAHEEH